MKNLIFNDYEDEKKIFKITDSIQDIIDIDTHFATMLILLALISINYDKLLNHIKNNRNNQIDAERIFNVVGFCLEWLDVDFNITENDVDDINRYFKTVNNIFRRVGLISYSLFYLSKIDK